MIFKNKKMCMSNKYAHSLLKNSRHVFSWGKCEHKFGVTKVPSQHGEIQGAKQHMGNLP